MKWNWQQSDWPNFNYDQDQLEILEKEFLKQSGVFIGVFLHLNEVEKNQIKIDIIIDEAVKTSEIEGEYLNRDSIQSSIRYYFGLETSLNNIPAAEQGIANMMTNLYESFNSEATHQLLCNWHKMLCIGRRDLNTIGEYRNHADPMQIISGPLHRPKIHFEAPPSCQMQQEMDQFLKFFNDSKSKLSPLIRASIAHLYFVSIHPFEDGNGRIARAIVEKALAEYLGYPSLIALSQVIEKNKKDYYKALEHTNHTNEITNWILYFAKTILEAQKYSLQQVEFVIKKAKFFDRYDSLLNQRQKKVIMRIFRAGINGFEGGLSADNYISITKTSRATATRDLQDLVEKKIFFNTGQLKSTRYFLQNF